MIQPPKFVNIGGQRFKIVVRKFDEWGEMRFDDREIHISTIATAKAQTMRSTLRHEMLHAALHIAGVSYAEKYDEENVVRAIENIFFPSWDRVRKQLESNA